MRVGITLPVAEDESYRATPYRDLRRLALATEQAGLDSIWAADHLLYQPSDERPRGFWESWTLLTALAEATDRVEIGNLTLCMPFRNPGLLAYMANTFEEVSGGRLVLGLGSGWHEPEFKAFGFEYERRVSYFEDSLEVLLPLLREGRVSYEGRLLSAEAPLSPRGPREGGPPILIASKGPRMQRLAARYADRWNTAWYALPREPFRERREGLWAACRELGRDPQEIEITVGLLVNDESAIDDENREGVLSATDSVLADAFAAWQEQGVAEVMCRLEPSTPEMVERVARAAEALDTTTPTLVEFVGGDARKR